MVQALLYQQANNAIGIENEICSISVLVSDHTAAQGGQQNLTTKNGLELRRTSREQ
jgi:hypothetical protein